MRYFSKNKFNVFYTFCLSVFLISCNQDFNNKSDNILENEFLNKKADSLFSLGKIYSDDSLNQKKALELYYNSLKLYKQLGNKLKVANLYKWIGYSYDYLEDYPNVKKYHKKALKIYTKINNKKQSAIVFNNLGIAYTISGDLDSALIFYKKGIDLTEITRDTAEFIEIYQNMGIGFSNAGKYEKAIESNMKALRYCEEINYLSSIVSLNLNIAQDYNNMGDIDIAFSYCKKASEYIDSIDNPYSLASLYNTLGELYFVKENYIKANKNYKKTLEICIKSDYKRGMATAYSNLASIAVKERNFNYAEKYVNMSIDLESEINHIDGVIVSLLELAEIQYSQKYYNKALKQIQKAENLCHEKGLYDKLPDIYYQYYQLYKLLGEQKKALKFCENYYTIKDSLVGVKLKERIAEIEIKYQTEKHQQEIKLLNKENNIKTHKLKARNLLIFSLVLLVVIIIGIAYFFKQKAKQKLDKMGFEIQKYILQINDLSNGKTKACEINSKEFSEKHDLTERETEVLQLICEGKSNFDIGEEIFISTNTVKYHIKNIYLKLDVKNRVEARNIAM